MVTGSDILGRKFGSEFGICDGQALSVGAYRKSTTCDSGYLTRGGRLVGRGIDRLVSIYSGPSQTRSLDR